MFLDDISKISQLPQPALGLLPAVHDAAVVEVSALPTTGLTGNVWKATAAMTLPAWGRWPARQVAVDEHFAHDGRFFYKVRQRQVPAVGETSWYPEAFERTLYTIHFSPKQLVVGGDYRFERQFDFRLISNSTNAVWSVIVEVGQRTVQDAPAPIGPNLLDYDWLEPLLEHQVVLTDVMCSHQLGVQIWNKADGYEASRLLYDKAESCPAGSLPTGSDFALRVRLGCFDTQNSVADPRGFVAYVAREIK
jgi:hypothetical protein